MVSSSRLLGSDLPPGDMPQRIFAGDCYPSHLVRINSYSRPQYLIDIMDVLAGTSELAKLLSSPLGPLFFLHDCQCALSGQLVHQLLCRQLHMEQLDELWFVVRGQPLRFSLLEFEEVTGLHCSALPSAEDILQATTYPERKSPYWYNLIGGKFGAATVDYIVEQLKSEPDMPSWQKFHLAFIVLVEGVCCIGLNLLNL